MKVRGLNVGLLAFSLLVLGGSAYVMTQTQLFRSGASNVVQSATGKLVKSGTPAFSPCKNISPTIVYALIGAQPETSISAKSLGSPVPSPKPSNIPPACTPLVTTAALADPLIGDRVVATGTFTNGIFYATELKLVSGTPNPRPSLPPQANPRAH